MLDDIAVRTSSKVLYRMRQLLNVNDFREAHVRQVENEFCHPLNHNMSGHLVTNKHYKFIVVYSLII